MSIIAGRLHGGYIADTNRVRRPLDAVPALNVGLVARRGSGLEPAATEFIELARERSRPAVKTRHRLRLERELAK